MALVLGLDAKCYYDDEGAYVGDWDEADNVKDLTLNLEHGEADVTTRGAAGWRLSVPTLNEATVDWDMVWDTEDPFFTAIQTAYFARSAIGLAVMDGDIETVGSQGLVGDFNVMKFTRNESLEEALTVSVSVKPTYSDTAPAWVIVSDS